MANWDDLPFKDDEPTQITPLPYKSEGDRLTEFFFGKRTDNADLTPIDIIRKQNGLCPKCGLKGPYRLSVPICPTHGAY